MAEMRFKLGRTYLSATWTTLDLERMVAMEQELQAYRFVLNETPPVFLIMGRILPMQTNAQYGTHTYPSPGAGLPSLLSHII